MRRLRLFAPWLFLVVACGSASGQAVIATHSGIVNFSEGAVFLDDQPLNQRFGTFPSVSEGSTLRTAEGRAELLLEPGVFLRLDENSAIQMTSTDLSKTRISFLRGAAIVDSSDRPAGTSLVLSYKTFRFNFPKPGLYRLNAEPGILETYSGEAEVAIDGQQPAKKIDQTHEFFLDIGTLTPKYGDGTVDAFSEWARRRSETIAAANRAEQGATDPGNLTTDPSYGGGYGDAFGAYSVPGIGPLYGPVAPSISVAPSFGYGTWDLYGSAWGSPFLLPNTFIYVLPVYYRRYPNVTHRSVYPTMTSSPLHTGIGTSRSPLVTFPVTSPRAGSYGPSYRTPAAGRAPATAPHYSAPAMHGAMPHVMVHR
ncbi:MAG: hypothetical protein JO319_21390 [Acidobacteriaceae bacterium]|nr:hypothetical protein [Acidobacteriaceae bacterium]